MKINFLTVVGFILTLIGVQTNLITAIFAVKELGTIWTTVLIFCNVTFIAFGIFFIFGGKE